MDKVWISKKVFFITVLLLCINFSCSNQYVTEDIITSKTLSTTFRLYIEGTKAEIMQETKETRSFHFNFEGPNLIPTINLKDGENVPSRCFIKNENPNIPIKEIPVEWTVRNKKLFCDDFNVDVDIPNNTKAGKWEVCFYIGDGTYNENTETFSIDAEKTLRPISNNQEQQWSFPYLSAWTELRIMENGKMSTSSVSFTPQGAFICTNIVNNTNEKISLKALSMRASDPSQAAGPFVWKAQWNIRSNEKEALTPVLSPKEENQGIICNLPAPIELKPGEVSGWYGFWVMPIGTEHSYASNIYAIPQDDETEHNTAWWVYNTPVEGRSNAQGPVAGRSYTMTFRLHKLINTTLANWMQDIDGNRLVCKMSIPGTHDAAANTGNGWVKTQDWDIKTQLENGIRFLDIRLVHDNGVIKLCHGSNIFSTTFVKDVLHTTAEFLQEHPSETVLMTIKRDHDLDHDHGVKYWQALMNVLNEDELAKKYMAGDFQGGYRMKDLRGKMLVISRDGWYTTQSGKVSSWPDNRNFTSSIVSNDGSSTPLIVEDHYKASATDKIKYVTNNLLEANKAFSETNSPYKWFITFTSYTGPNGIAMPRYTTTYVDPDINKKLKESDNFKCSGILLSNFPGWYNINQTVIKLNKGVNLP
ncbi:phosphatidylinositol-specific phospholipase C domain-containing protein [Prevotella jejuni]|uniref:phosphatidylinositol-specific phospholipase C domain-containing protein n=1 Tax=Prevotella jejuni TaxID=1177574 RepID=UPI001BAD6033|nr:phosphatidylinositol-specific phospholipase C domain-containing protein [Prevotella jejuni]QUB81122.1 phosphatidylinositol-specific phospholipase C domain-containing protein [Prevotella jejuni]